MMERWVVVDTNLIFSSLIASSSSIRDTLLDESFQFHAPNFIIAELFKHKERLLRFSKLSEPELLELFNGITERIQFTPLDFISQKSRDIAFALCMDVDAKDTPFVALAIELDAPLWTGDKKLVLGLRKKGFDRFFEI
ncbi:MAG: nucleotide-binding protein [Haliscomenobacter sp.]|nr:nucleotide-binding protein [Haliscomenobacter sp.]